MAVCRRSPRSASGRARASGLHRLAVGDSTVPDSQMADAESACHLSCGGPMSGKSTRAALVAVVTVAAATSLWGYTAHETRPIAPCVPGVVCLLPCVDRSATDSRYCLSCHDGASGPAIGSSVAGAPNNRNHAFGVSYYGARPSRQLRSTPDPAVVLVGANVECTTCHNYWAIPRQAHWVAMPELCGNGCHAM